MSSYGLIPKIGLLGLAAALISVLSGGAGSRAAEKEAPDHLTIRLRADDLRQGLRRASASVGSEKNSTHDWNRVLVEASAAAVTLVGTDGRRMTVVELAGLEQRKAADPTATASLSLNEVNTAIEMLEDLDGDVSVDVSSDRLAIAKGKTELRMPTAKARFPDWRRVIPKTDDGVAVTVNAGELLVAAAQAEPESGERSVASMKLSRNKLTVTAGSAAAGRAASELPVEYEGAARVVDFNPSYLRSFAGLLKKDEAVKIVLHGPNDAILFVTDDACKFVLAPIRRAE
jgi:DNA polymerase III subunit beta